MKKTKTPPTCPEKTVRHFENINVNINPQDKSVTDSINELARAAKANADAISQIALIAKGPQNLYGLYIND